MVTQAKYKIRVLNSIPGLRYPYVLSIPEAIRNAEGKQVTFWKLIDIYPTLQAAENAAHALLDQ